MGDDSLEKHIQIDGGGSEKPKTTANNPFLEPELKGSSSGNGGGGGNETPLAAMPVGPIKQFYRDLVMLLTEPRIFFEVRYPQTSFSYALAFGIIVNWIAAFISWLTRIVRHETLLDGLLKMRDQLQSLPFWKTLPDNFWAQNIPETSPDLFPAWLAELFGIIASPFQSLIGFFFYGILIFLGAYLLVPKDSNRDRVEVKNAVQIVAFASAPVLVSAILGFLPFNIGNLIGGIYGFILLVFALSLRFRVSGLRAFGIVILPGVIGALALSCVVGVFGALILGLGAAIFGGFH